MTQNLHAMTAVFGLLMGVVLSTSTMAQNVAPLDKIQNQQELNQAITELDTALFDAYNKCDLAKFGSFIDENVEFYHDQGGLTLGRAALVESVKKNICGTTTRELVPGTLQIYYMKGYGAIEIGVHRFRNRRWRRQVCPPLAIQRWSMEGDTSAEL